MHQTSSTGRAIDQQRDSVLRTRPPFVRLGTQSRLALTRRATCAADVVAGDSR